MTPDRRRWTALLAPLDVVSPDSRWLNPQGPWRLRTPAPLLTLHERRTIGALVLMDVGTTQLRGFGWVDDPDAAQDMRTGQLRPQIEMGPMDAGWDEQVLRVRSGTITSVVAGPLPCWPEATFTVGASWQEIAQELNEAGGLDHLMQRLDQI